MDHLAPLLNQTSLSARVFFTGKLCQAVNFDVSEIAGHIHLVKSGRLSITLEGKEVVIIDKPSVVFFPRPHNYKIQPTDPELCELLCASIDLGLIVRSPLAMALPETSIIPLSKLSSISATLNLLFEEAFSEHYGRQTALNKLSEFFLIQIIRYLMNAGKIKDGIFSALLDQRLAKAVNAIHERPEFSWTLETLAEVAGMSRARFAVNFRDKSGMTPLEYLTDWRVSIVKKLVLQGRSISSIAPLVGYQSHAALTRMITKRLGVPPKEWAEKLSNLNN